MKLFFEKLKEKRSEASGAFEICVGVIIVVMFITLIFAVFSGIFKAVQFQESASLVIEKAALNGGITEDVVEEIQRQADVNGVSISVSYDAPDGWYSESAKKVQYGDDIVIYFEATIYVEIWGRSVIPVDVSAVRTGRSNVYWKGE